MKNNIEIEISIVAPCYNEEEVLPEFVSRTISVIKCLNRPFEIILVNDGSKDSTLEIAISLAKKHPEIKVINFSRNFGHQAAVTAGIDYAEGKAVILIDADLQDPPEVINEMVQKWHEGYEVVYAQRRTREGETKFKLFTAKLFYRLFSLMTDKSVPENTGDFRLMDRKVVEEIKNMREKHRFIRGMVSWVGFKQIPVLYDRNARFAGETSYPFKKMLRFSLDAIISFSTIPLRFITLLGIFTIVVTVLFSAIILIIRIFQPEYFIPGFSVTTLLLLLFGGFQLFAIGIIGEYIGRIFEEIKNRPLYIIKDIYQTNLQKQN
jgi:dolichol-phosphate mannosyltransferase